MLWLKCMKCVDLVIIHEGVIFHSLVTMKVIDIDYNPKVIAMIKVLMIVDINGYCVVLG